MERLGSSSALTAAVLKGITSSYEKTRNIASKLLVVTLLVFSNHVSAQEDILDFMPAIIAAATAANSCSDGVYATCTNSVGCRRIDGVFENGQCSAKPLGRSLAEQFAGTWSAQTNFDNGLFHNLFTFDVGTLAKVPSSPDYVIKGTSYSSNVSSGNFRFPTAVSHDSRNDDWFILDFWGTDIGLASSIEITRTSENQFDGCEFVIEFPDMTYRDGICNPIRLRRVGEAPSTIRVIQNFVSDIGSYVADLFGITQTGPRPSTVDTARPTVANIAGLPTSAMQITSPLAITSPENRALINGISSQIQGTVEQDINFNGLTVNGRNVAVDGGAFDANIGVEEGRNTVIVEADFGRRTFSAELTLEVDNEPPLLIAAASTSSSSVVVQFSEAMIDSLVDDVANFNITRNDNSANLPITAIEFVNDSHTSVRLFTGLQNNVGYTLRAVNTRDAAGNVISGPISETDISVTTAEFVGTRPTGDEILDTDDDGIFDHVELTGYQVIVRRTDGSSEIIQVTSDPFSDDADNDGVSDAEERHAGTDPLNRDTDGDTLSDGDEWNRIYSNPVDQDTDRDGIQDGFEFLFFKTSPILADTDGDQIDDPTELAAGNRNPLVADLPSPDIDVGNINLQLDTRFTFTDSQGQTRSESQTSEATLSQSENDTLSSSNENSTGSTVNQSRSLSETVSGEYNFGANSTGGFGARATVGFSVTATQSTEEGSSRGATVQFGEESSRASEEAYHDSLTSSSEVSVDETVTRELVDGAVRVDLSIDNAGDIPFTISNLELTALTQNPNNRRELIPVASLTPQNSNLDSVNIGALSDTARGPFVFSTQPGAVFPAEVEQLLKNPRGLIVQLANFDIVDEQGNNFAFTSQQVLDRTAGISFDLGDGRTEKFRIATASDHDESTGLPSGITMKRALEIIGLVGVPTIRDGGNGRVDTVLVGDDVAIAEFRSFVDPRTVIIEPGENGVLDTIILGGDDRLVMPDYETTQVTPAARIVDGGNGRVDTVANPADVQVSAVNTAVLPGQLIIRAGNDTVLQTIIPSGDPNNDDILLPAGAPREVLTRFKDVEANSDNAQFWVLFTSENVEAVDLDEIVLRSGQQYNFTYIQDSDLDGVWAREEYLHGSSDLRTNTDGCDLPDGIRPDPCDTLPDALEIQEGWRVQLRTSPQGFRVYSNPNQADSDRDLLLDHQERACALDPRQRDTDLDGLTDWEELFGMTFDDNGMQVPLVSRDPATNEIVQTVVLTPYSGSNGTLVPHVSIQACDQSLQIDGFVTDPLNADTDGDRISDARELTLGLNPNDSSDGGDFLDDDGDGLSNTEEQAPRTISINGLSVVVTSDPNSADSDNDGLPDLLERFLGSNPRLEDSDGDGLTDRNEYSVGGSACVTTGVGTCTSFINLPSRGFNTYLQECEAAFECNNSAIEAALSNSPQYGTSLTQSDTDNDGIDDNLEIGTFTITVNGGSQEVSSDPFNFDTDSDGLSDGVERNVRFTNPRAFDTDGDDGVSDSVEVARGRNPTVSDKRLQINARNVLMSVRSNSILNVDIRPQGGSFTNCLFSRGELGNLDASDTLPADPTNPNSARALPCAVGTFIVAAGAPLSIGADIEIRPNGGIAGGCTNADLFGAFPRIVTSFTTDTPSGIVTTPESSCRRRGTSGGTSDFTFQVQYEVTAD